MRIRPYAHPYPSQSATTRNQVTGSASSSSDARLASSAAAGKGFPPGGGVPLLRDAQADATQPASTPSPVNTVKLPDLTWATQSSDPKAASGGVQATDGSPRRAQTLDVSASQTNIADFAQEERYSRRPVKPAPYPQS
jgi:hypothetical protein